MEEENNENIIAYTVEDAFDLLNMNFMNLTMLCREKALEPVISLRPLAKDILKIMMQENGNVPLLVGDSEMTRQFAIQEVAEILTSHHLPFDFQDKEVYFVSTANLQRLALENPEYPRFLEMVLRAAQLTQSVLFIDNLCAFCELNFNEGYAAEALFHGGLSVGSLHVIAGVPTQKAKCLLHRPVFSENERSFFTRLDVPNPGPEDSLTLVQNYLPKLESNDPGEVRVTEDAVRSALELCQKYSPNQSLPEAAIELLENAKNDALIEKELRKSSKRGRPSKSVPLIDSEQVRQTAARVMHARAADSVTLDRKCLTSLEASLRSRVIGQDEAIQAVTAALRLSAAGLKEPNKPKGVFLFAGSTGTGKTEMAKALAETLYGSTEHLIRIDMSEYTEYHNVSRLFGSPPGYVGFEGGGQLTNAIEKTPDCVLLLDEIEKAHPMVLNTFLQVFDDGRLTDGHGKTYSFRNAVIIMTTNLGAGALDQLQPKRIGFCDGSTSIFSEPGKDLYQHKVMEAIKGRLLPEFLNRVTKTIVFNPLDQGTIHIILDKTIEKKMRLIADRQIHLELCTEARALLEKEGFNPMNGAREMERSVDRLLMLPLADYLLEHEGLCEKTLHAEIKENGIVFMEERR